MFHCFTFFLVICFCILRLSLNTPALCPSFHGASPQSGEKPRLCLQEPAHRDHPRMGGEKTEWEGRAIDPDGSPPHGRGKVHSQLLVVGIVRITPAWAGKSTPARARREKPQDHPRAGGEKSVPVGLPLVTAGSPPRWRGKVRASRLAVGDGGITPAWAGKSPASQPWSPPLWMMVIRPRP